ncbi:hypothetical protein P154DRAFT_285989 [Amniculicola lignicola CBS 123094]|uniref:Uncharacterized protein n=1 Tax=Amniculicola lignicola CBS 123094 TaxID=1392246 RepID=A0A6A5WVQ1_9PLEO|nr:hypothetical protein P154DRAFT_285989 [Amniculicola lignicola CBS 123094]
MSEISQVRSCTEAILCREEFWRSFWKLGNLEEIGGRAWSVFLDIGEASSTWKRGGRAGKKCMGWGSRRFDTSLELSRDWDAFFMIDWSALFTIYVFFLPVCFCCDRFLSSRSFRSTFRFVVSTD